MKNFHGHFRSPRMFRYKGKTAFTYIYLQYSERSPLQKIQHEAKCYYAALLPRRGPHIASHSVCPSVCVRLSRYRYRASRRAT